MAHPQWMQGCEDVSHTRMDQKIRMCLDLSTEILICGISITANIFLNNVLKFVNTYIQLIKTPVQGKKMQTL